MPSPNVSPDCHKPPESYLWVGNHLPSSSRCLLPSLYLSSSTPSNTAKEFVVSIRSASGPFSFLHQKTPLTTSLGPASQYLVRNSSHTSEILRWNSASTYEIFIMKALRLGELTHPAETIGKAGKAITTYRSQQITHH
ncbi:hypothetical protein E2C01_004865 [Portunus trituberculatus]|uniref:Uncharacterized protein n=1 Tax=Portunus trituberculatus TaxID=210409 RepID=A0A5B7CQT9_PORTR|nr:hypothetical protein [Portunus trituberculatus]